MDRSRQKVIASMWQYMGRQHMNRLGLFNTSTTRTAFSIHGGGEAIDSPELSFKSTSNDGGEGGVGGMHGGNHLCILSMLQ